MTTPLKDLDKIKASKEQKQQALLYALHKQKKSMMTPKRMILTTCSIAVCVVLLLSILMKPSTVKQNASPVIATVSFDINPSLEFKLDENYKVVKLETYNEDAKRIVKQANLEGKDFKEAVDTLMKNPEYAKYLDTGILEVGVYAQTKQVTKMVEGFVNEYLANTLESNQYHCSSIDQKTHDDAKQHHTSGGKYRVIEMILEYDTTYTIDELKTWSMSDLYKLLNKYDKDSLPENCRHKLNEKGNRHGNHN